MSIVEGLSCSGNIYEDQAYLDSLVMSTRLSGLPDFQDCQ